MKGVPVVRPVGPVGSVGAVAGGSGVFKVGRIRLVPIGYVKIAIENGPIEIVDFPMKHGGSFHSYVSKRMVENDRI